MQESTRSPAPRHAAGGAPQKEPYHPPTLTEHGTLQEIALTSNPGSGYDLPLNYS